MSDVFRLANSDSDICEWKRGERTNTRMKNNPYYRVRNNKRGQGECEKWCEGEAHDELRVVC